MSHILNVVKDEIEEESRDSFHTLLHLGLPFVKLGDSPHISLMLLANPLILLHLPQLFIVFHEVPQVCISGVNQKFDVAHIRVNQLLAE